MPLFPVRPFPFTPLTFMHLKHQRMLLPRLDSGAFGTRRRVRLLTRGRRASVAEKLRHRGADAEWHRTRNEQDKATTRQTLPPKSLDFPAVRRAQRLFGRQRITMSKGTNTKCHSVIVQGTSSRRRSC